MPRYSKDYKPTNADFEQIALEIVELDPNQERLRGPSNSDGDDGLHRNRETGDLHVTEAKYARESSRIPAKYIDNLAEAVASQAELHGAKATGTLFTTAEGLTRGAKAHLKERAADGIAIKVVCHKDLKDVAANLPPDNTLKFALESALAVKARPSKKRV